MKQLRQLLLAIDGKGYKSYKRLRGRYRFPEYLLDIDHVQGDPYAAPTRISIRVPADQLNYPDTLTSTGIRRQAMMDFLGRRIASAIRDHVKGHRGSGRSGEIGISTSGQQILERNALILARDCLEVRLIFGLPADGRSVAGRDASEMFLDELPLVIKQGLFLDTEETAAACQHVDSVEDQEALRSLLEENNLVGFVAEGALLPRRSGVDDRPLVTDALPFTTPPSLRCTLQTPHHGSVTGMGIPRGITLIVGGGFHGKSTLLHALERGVYNHVPGDGRERVVSVPDAVKVRAEDGRSIARVDISPFIGRLPFGRETQCFSTPNASGSTSQAANIIEALDCGTRLLLIDEDTSATNFMIRDERMQALVSREQEPITPFLHRVRELYEAHGVSTVIVMGGSGDYFDVADTVIMLDAYQPRDVTAEALRLARDLPAAADELPSLTTRNPRRPGPKTLDPSRGHRDVKIDALERNTLGYGEHRINLSAVEQLVDIGQTRSIGLMIHYYAKNYAGNIPDLVPGLQRILDDAAESGLDLFSPYKVGDLAMPRLFELAAAINRIRNDDWT